MNKNAYKIAGVYVAMIIGAGFASGQELLQFFLKYGLWGFLGIALSSFLIFLVGYAVLSLAINNSLNTQSEFFKKIAGENFSLFIEIMIGFMFFVFYTTMVSAAGAAFDQVFNLNFTKSVILFSLLCFFALIFGVKALVRINTLIAPILVIGGLFIGIYTIIFETRNAFSSGADILLNNWLTSAVIYAAYNIVTSVSVLVSIKDYAADVKSAKKSAMISGITLFVLGSVLMLGLYLNREFVSNFEIPVLAMIYKHGYLFEYLYLFILLLAIFTTAIGNGFSFIEFLNSKLNISRLNTSIILFFLGIFFAHIGFSNFVGKVYPAFAIVGILEIIFILFSFVKKK